MRTYSYEVNKCTTGTGYLADFDGIPQTLAHGETPKEAFFNALDRLMEYTKELPTL